jgi:beta-glucanase (GH16 family)
LRGRRTGLIVLAGIIVLAVVAGVVTAVALVSNNKKSGANAAPNRPAGNVSAADPARGGVSQGQPVDPGQANAGASSAANSPSAAPSKPNATLVDNFDGTAPDPHRWGLYESTKSNGAKWLKSNVQVHNGELQLIGSGNDPTGKANTAAGLCWCGDGGNRLYGTWEVRARYDAGSGYGQVIGLWPRSDSQADGSLSFADTSDPARQNMHGRVVTSAAPGTVSTSVNGDFTAWHTFKVDWRATSIKMYVDGKIFFDSTTSSTKVTIPKTPMHIIMQQPVGPGSGVPAANASTPTKVILHVDWVKVSP